jgi:F0F1-type ATP synthase assembly protein I
VSQARPGAEWKGRRIVVNASAAGVANNRDGHAMTAPDRDKRPPIAVAMELASHVISVALMMALPAGIGYWADVKFGSLPWLVVVGAVVGLGAGLTYLLRGMATTEKKSSNERRNTDERPQ